MKMISYALCGGISLAMAMWFRTWNPWYGILMSVLGFAFGFSLRTQEHA